MATRGKKEKEYPPMPANWMYKRGDVYMMDLNPYSGSEQGGIRPAIVVQNDDGNFLFQCSSGRSTDNTDQKAKYANAFYSAQSFFECAIYGDLRKPAPRR